MLHKLRFLSVSALCLLLHNAVMIVGDHGGLTFAFSLAISFCVSATVGYVLHCRFTFAQELAVSRFVRYVAMVSLNLPLAYITVWFWHSFVGLHMVLASPIATACAVFVNYFLSRSAILPTTRTVG